MGRYLIIMKVRDLGWLAGLLEGEGCFRLNRGKYPVIALAMTDEDVVVKAAILMKVVVYHYRNEYRIQVYGIHAIGWMMTLYSLLCSRRKSKVAGIIKFWGEHLYTREIRYMAKCHPDKVMHSLGLCKTCYGKQWRGKQLLRRVG